MVDKKHTEMNKRQIIDRQNTKYSKILIYVCVSVCVCVYV